MRSSDDRPLQLLQEAMIFNRALGEADLHGIYRGHYRSGSRSGSNTVRASHSLENNIDGSAITAHKSAYAGVSDKLISHIDSLVGYWALDGDATDSSGNGLDGTAANAEWVAGVCKCSRSLCVFFSKKLKAAAAQTDWASRSMATTVSQCPSRRLTPSLSIR